MKMKDYCNKLLKVTLRDRTVKCIHFTDLKEYRLFMKMATIFEDIQYIDVYDHANTKLVSVERVAEKINKSPRRVFPMETSVSIRKGDLYGKICHTSCYTTKAGRSSKK